MRRSHQRNLKNKKESRIKTQIQKVEEKSKKKNCKLTPIKYSMNRNCKNQTQRKWRREFNNKNKNDDKIKSFP